MFALYLYSVFIKISMNAAVVIMTVTRMQHVLISLALLTVAARLATSGMDAYAQVLVPFTYPY